MRSRGAAVFMGGLVLSVAVMVAVGIQHGSTQGAGSPSAPAAGVPVAAPSSGPVSVPRGNLILAKDDGWRAGLVQEFQARGEWEPFALVEIAYSPEAARSAWEQNRPSTATKRIWPPSAPGVYASLDDVDMATYAVVVFSSGQSGSCPGWLSDLDVNQHGTVIVHTAADSGAEHACHADYRWYRLVLAVDRSKLLQPGQLPTRNALINGASPGGGVLVRAYPAELVPSAQPAAS